MTQIFPTFPEAADQTGGAALPEEERLSELFRHQILDTAPEAAFDRITNLARRIFDMPISLITLVDRDRQWFKSRQDFSFAETPRDISFCAHAVESDGPIMVEDASCDPRFQNNPLVTGDPGIRFYAGVPLKSATGHNLGALCVIDRVKRQVEFEQLGMLHDLAQLAMDQIHLRMVARVDRLTGLLSIPVFEKEAARELKLAREQRRPSSLVRVEITSSLPLDRSFPSVIWDRLIRRLAGICQSVANTTDLIARTGEAEFTILMPGISRHGAICIAYGIQRQCEEAGLAFGTESSQIQAEIRVSDAEFSELLVEELAARATRVDYASRFNLG